MGFWVQKWVKLRENHSFPTLNPFRDIDKNPTFNPLEGGNEKGSETVLTQLESLVLTLTLTSFKVQACGKAFVEDKDVRNGALTGAVTVGAAALARVKF